MKKDNLISKNNNTVDLVKFVAAILVVFSHSFSLSNNTKDYLTRWISDASFGSFAVAIFFAFSGYYITKSILKNSNSFIKKRLWRLLPELILVVLITIFVVGPIFTTISLKSYFTSKDTYIYILNGIMIPIHNLPGVFLNNIFGRTVNGALWTLSVEFLCYVFIYIIYKLKLLNKEKSILLFFVSIILSTLGYILFKYMNLSIMIAMIRPFLVFEFSSLLFFYIDKVDKKKFIIVMLLSVLTLLIRSSISYNMFLIIELPILLCYISNNIIIKNNVLSFLGKISYSIYLVGFVTQQCVISINGGTMNSYINFCISSLISIILALFVYFVTNKIVSLLKEEKI